jgi:hypothetical protein
MTLEDFQRLCQDQWSQPERGDVSKLWLTDESAIELTRDILQDGNTAAWLATHLTKYEIPAVKAGGSIPRVVNPITRSDVAVTPGNPSDTAVVSFGGHAPARLVPL